MVVGGAVCHQLLVLQLPRPQDLASSRLPLQQVMHVFQRVVEEEEEEEEYHPLSSSPHRHLHPRWVPCLQMVSSPFTLQPWHR